MREEKTGHWEGEVFVFDEPIDIGDGGLQMKRLDFSQINLAEGLSREDVLEALTDPDAKVMQGEDNAE